MFAQKLFTLNSQSPAALGFVSDIETTGDVEVEGAQREIKVDVKDLDLFYGEYQALHGIKIAIPAREVTAFIGPSGCGKSTFLRTMNRMNDLIDGVRVRGTVTIDEENIYSPSVDLIALRKRVGMVFQKSNPFPKSIFENVAFGPRIHGLRDQSKLEEIVERSLTRSDLWKEVKDRLHKSALDLSGGQ